MIRKQRIQSKWQNKTMWKYLGIDGMNTYLSSKDTPGLVNRRKPVYFSVFAALVVMSLNQQLVHAGSLGAHAGTLGFGVEATQSLHRKLNSRIGFNTLSTSLEDSYDGVDYNANIDFKTLTALLDWHPFAGTFRLSGGLVLNNSAITIRNKQITQTFTFGNSNYTSSDLALEGDISFQPFAPYVGLGWSSAPAKKSGFGFSAEIGIMYSGSPDIQLSASGTATDQNNPNSTFNVAADPGFQENLAREEKNLQDDYKKYKYFPVLSMGVTYAF